MTDAPLPVVPKRRMVRRYLLGLCAFFFATLLGAYLASLVDPVERHAAIGLPDWPGRAAPVRVVLLSDIHLGNASMGGARLYGIIDQVAALQPDLVLIAGDFLAGYDKPLAAQRSDEIARELKRLRPPLGIVAVLGNHDEATNPILVTAALRHAGVTVLKNEAVRKGPLVIGGLGDGYSGNARVAPMLAAMQPLAGARIAMMHSPADVLSLPDDITLAIAGHTHCGQIVLPFYGPVALPSVPARYACGLVTERSRRIVISGGLGTSSLPLRVGAPPDMWLLTLGPVDLRPTKP